MTLRATFPVPLALSIICTKQSLLIYWQSWWGETEVTSQRFLRKKQKRRFLPIFYQSEWKLLKLCCDFQIIPTQRSPLLLPSAPKATLTEFFAHKPDIHRKSFETNSFGLHSLNEAKHKGKAVHFYRTALPHLLFFCNFL